MLTIRLEEKLAADQMLYFMGNSKVFIEIDNAGTLVIFEPMPGGYKMDL